MPLPNINLKLLKLEETGLQHSPAIDANPQPHHFHSTYNPWSDSWPSPLFSYYNFGLLSDNGHVHALRNVLCDLYASRLVHEGIYFPAGVQISHTHYLMSQ